MNASLSFFDVFSEAEQQALMALAARRQFSANATIFREGELGDAVYLIESGRVGLEICTPGIGCRRVLTVSSGELLGWSPLLGAHEPLTATARSMTDVAACEFKTEPLSALCERDPVLGFKLMCQVSRALARRLTAARLQLLDIHQGAGIRCP